MALTQKEISTRFYRRRKEQGLCVDCGKPMDRIGARCSERNTAKNQANQETRHCYLQYRICPECRKEKLFGDENKCPECKAKQYIAYRRKRTADIDKARENDRKQKKEIVKRHKELGLCSACGKEIDDKNYKLCSKCRHNSMMRARKYRAKEDKVLISEIRKQNGWCRFCNNPVDKGYKVCAYHRNIAQKNANSENTKKARKKLVNDGILY